jgi:hypothetical protein
MMENQGGKGNQKYLHCRNAFKKYLAEHKENLGLAKNEVKLTIFGRCSCSSS